MSQILTQISSFHVILPTKTHIGAGGAATQRWNFCNRKIHLHAATQFNNALPNSDEISLPRGPT